MTVGSLARAVPGRLGRPRWRVDIRLPLAVVAVLPFAIPLAWLVSSALKPVDQFYSSPPAMLPGPPSLENVSSVLRILETPRLFANSMLISVVSAVAAVASSAVVGYAFAALPARGRRPLFALLLATIMIPQAVMIVPQFILFSRLGWVGTYLPLIVPHLFGSAFYIFLFRQWFRGIPESLLESAELEGASPWQAFRHIALPLARPAIAAVGVFAFVASWNDLLGPLVYLRAPESFTVSLGMASLDSIYADRLHLSVAMALIALVPPMLVFVVAQRFLHAGVTTSGWRA